MSGKDSESRYQFTVTLLEDLHTGTGTGAGAELDAVQIVDQSGQPVIRDTHLKGLLRAAGEDLVRLGVETADKVQQLFGDGGSSNQGALFVRSLRLVREVGGTDDCGVPQQPHPGRRLVWTSTAREKFSRVPRDDTLRTVEYVAAGTRFAGEMTLRNPDLAALLDRCVKRLDRLGSRRNRGAGLICSKLVGPMDMQPANTPPERQAGQIRLRLLLKNLEPLCLPLTGYPGNIISSECYIRGQQLLGAFAAWSLAQGGDARLWLERKVSVGNALPLPSGLTVSAPNELQRWDVAPMPLHLYTYKPSGPKNLNWPW
jgi:hypothetical protein